MKKLLTIAIAMLISFAAYSQSDREEMRRERAEKRAERQASYEKYTDSLVLTRDYEFIPQTYQQQPTGMMRSIYSSVYYFVSVSPKYIQISLPYIKGYTPPYYTTYMNFDSFYPNGYIAVQQEHGWSIKFEASGFDGNTYTFDFFVNYVGGETTLNISTPSYNTVTYSGYITGY